MLGRFVPRSMALIWETLSLVDAHLARLKAESK
jgi:hypothetical protein